MPVFLAGTITRGGYGVKSRTERSVSCIDCVSILIQWRRERFLSTVYNKYAIKSEICSGCAVAWRGSVTWSEGWNSYLWKWVQVTESHSSLKTISGWHCYGTIRLATRLDVSLIAPNFRLPFFGGKPQWTQSSKPKWEKRALEITACTGSWPPVLPRTNVNHKILN